MIRSVVIIGSGNLAEALARAVAASPLSLRQVFGRNRDRVAAVAALSGTVGESDPSRLARADIYLIAVSDAAVAEVASSLPIDAAAVVAHTAGSVRSMRWPAFRGGLSSIRSRPSRRGARSTSRRFRSSSRPPRPTCAARWRPSPAA